MDGSCEIDGLTDLCKLNVTKVAWALHRVCPISRAEVASLSFIVGSHPEVT